MAALTCFFRGHLSRCGRRWWACRRCGSIAPPGVTRGRYLGLSGYQTRWPGGYEKIKARLLREGKMEK